MALGNRLKKLSQMPGYGYGVAVVCSMLVLILRLILFRLGVAMDYPFLLFSLAVLVSSWVGGLGPGVLATTLTTAAIVYFFIYPYHNLSLSYAEDTITMGLYLAQDCLIVLLGHTNKISIARLRQSHQELAFRVEERTAELRQSNHQLQVLNRKLKTSNRELQDFAFVASHDLQEPLRKISTFGDCLSREYTPILGETGRDYLARMQSAANRMQVLINDLLLFSRVTARTQRYSPVDLNAVAAEVLTDLEVRIQQSNARIEVDPLPEIEADPTQMRQLIQNLIVNALKFHQSGASPRVRVFVEANDAIPAPDGQATDAIRLCVQDNGIGFDEKYLDRIFTVFQRLHGRGVYEGTGIGLAICRKIAARHGGSIGAHSRPGEGATFIVTLPRRQREEGNA